MMAKILVVTILMVFYISHGALAADDWWMDLPYESKDFNYKVKYGENVTMACNDTAVPDGYSLQYWIRSDLTVMLPDSSEYFYTLDGYAGWYVNSTDFSMDVVIVQERQFGFYHCVLASDTNASMIYVVKTGINYEKAYFGDLWEKYELNTIIGLSAAGGFCLICIALMLVCKFKTNSDDDDDDDYEDVGSTKYKDEPDVVVADAAFDNVAYIEEKVAVGPSNTEEENTAF